jgi:hypothetical protein
MKKHGLLLAGALAGCLTYTTAATAQDAPFYLGVKVGSMDADFSGFDRAVNIGVNVGYELMRDSRGALAVEGEYTTTASDGEISGGGEWDVDTLAAYAVYRTTGDLYVKGKAGYLNQDIKGTGAGATRITSSDDSGFAYGIGAGWRLDRKSSLEVEYTAASDELNFISLGYVTRF